MREKNIIVELEVAHVHGSLGCGFSQHGHPLKKVVSYLFLACCFLPRVILLGMLTCTIAMDFVPIAIR